MSQNSLNIDPAELRLVAELLLGHLEETAGDSIKLDKDYFWTIEPGSRYNVHAEPQAFTIGQLSESWSNLGGLDEGNVTSYALVWLSDVLRAIGEEVVR